MMKGDILMWVRGSFRTGGVTVGVVVFACAPLACSGSGSAGGATADGGSDATVALPPDEASLPGDSASPLPDHTTLDAEDEAPADMDAQPATEAGDRIVAVGYNTAHGGPFGACPSGCWGTPALGSYRSDDPGVIRQHAAWLADAGFDYISEDWSNDTAFVYGDPSRPDLQYIEQTFLSVVGVYTQMDTEGLPHPKVAVMLGGSTATDPDGGLSIQRKTDQVAHQLLDDPNHPQFASMYQAFDGAPVLWLYGMDTWDYTNHGVTPFTDPRFTLRYGWAWFSRQGQYMVQPDGLKTVQADLNWPWQEDGRFLASPNDMPSEGPPVSMNGGKPELVQVQAFQNGDIPALNRMGRDDGQYYRSRWAYARAVDPKIIFVTAFNEWNQGEGPTVEDSKDIEPEMGGHGDLYMQISRQEIAAWKGTQARTAVARVYQNAQFNFVPDGQPIAGYAVDLKAGAYTSADLEALGISDQSISSFLVAPGYKMVLCDTVTCTVPGARFYRDVPDLSSVGWNDRISSLVICQTRPTAPPAAGAGLSGAYYDNATFAGSPVLNTVEGIAFDGGASSPIQGGSGQAWSAQWTGYIQASASGPYFFEALARGSVQIWVNGQLILDNNHPGNPDSPRPRGYSYGIYLDAGESVPITIQYVPNTASASLQLLWRLGAYQNYATVPLTAYETTGVFRDCE